MPTILAYTWETHFSSNNSNKASNKSMSALFLNFNHQKTIKVCISNAAKEVGVIVIAKAPISNHIMLIHYFTKLGGIRTNPNEKYFVLVRTGMSTYPARTIKESCFNSSAGHSVSTWASVTDLTDAVSVSTLTTSANSSQKIFCNCFLLHPLITTALMASEQSSPEMIIRTIEKSALLTKSIQTMLPSIKQTNITKC